MARSLLDHELGRANQVRACDVLAWIHNRKRILLLCHQRSCSKHEACNERSAEHSYRNVKGWIITSLKL